jgi:hypothetical protein
MLETYDPCFPAVELHEAQNRLHMRVAYETDFVTKGTSSDRNRYFRNQTLLTLDPRPLRSLYTMNESHEKSIYYPLIQLTKQNEGAG